LSKLFKQGIIDDTVPDNVDSDSVDNFEVTTCWIAAENALHYAKSKISEVSEVFDRWNIQESDYIVLAGFDESLIKSGVGYLEQIHVFVSAEINPGTSSPLLSELGRVFSPFSSILFTESSSYPLPVLKDDRKMGSDELTCFTALDDGRSSPTLPSTMITPPVDDSPTDVSPRSSGKADGEKNETPRPKVKERDVAVLYIQNCGKNQGGQSTHSLKSGKADGEKNETPRPKVKVSFHINKTSILIILIVLMIVKLLVVVLIQLEI